MTFTYILMAYLKEEIKIISNIAHFYNILHSRIISLLSKGENLTKVLSFASYLTFYLPRYAKCTNTLLTFCFHHLSWKFSNRFRCDSMFCFSKLLSRELVIEQSKHSYFHEKEGIADLDLKKWWLLAKNCVWLWMFTAYPSMP